MALQKSKYRAVLAISLLLVLGLFLTGSGITGMIVSQSCCSGPDCDPEYLCEYAKEPSTETPDSSTMLTTTGILAIAVAGMIYLNHKKHFIPPLEK